MPKLNVKHVAILASLPLTKKDEEKLEGQLETTLKHVDNLQTINTDNIPPTNQVTNLLNVMREDEIKPSLTQEEALKNAKKTYNGFFVVPAVLAE